MKKGRGGSAPSRGRANCPANGIEFREVRACDQQRERRDDTGHKVKALSVPFSPSCVRAETDAPLSSLCLTGKGLGGEDNKCKQ